MFLEVQNASISDFLSIRIYEDTRPRSLKIKDLQKGIVLLYKNAEVVGEGIGFGVPVVKYADETFFSGSSKLQVHRKGNAWIIQKVFFIDLIERNKFRNIIFGNKRLRGIIDFIARLYQKHNYLAQSGQFLRELLLVFGIKPIFIKTTSKGKVTATYKIENNLIEVNLNFNQLDRHNLLKIFVLNEQGASFFRRYSDSEGLSFVDEEIGIWKIVEAKTARITDAQNRISFSLKNVKGAMLRRGRESTNDQLNWIGLDYELYPIHETFEYQIEVFG